MSIITTFYSDEEKTNALYPITKTKAIYDDNNVSLEQRLNNIQTEIQNARMGYDLLWQNANGTSQFASQNIDLSNADNYSFFLICFKGSSTWEDQINNSLLIPNINTYFTLTFVDTSRVVHHRGAHLYSTYINFENGKQNGNTSNAESIPMYIYGIK